MIATNKETEYRGEIEIAPSGTKRRFVRFWIKHQHRKSARKDWLVIVQTIAHLGTKTVNAGARCFAPDFARPIGYFSTPSEALAALRVRFTPRNRKAVTVSPDVPEESR